MRDIDPVLIHALKGEEYQGFRGIEMLIDGTYYRYTSCDIPLVVNGNRYDPRPFQMQEISYSKEEMIDQVEVEIANQDDILTPVFVGGTPQGANATIRNILTNISQSTSLLTVNIKPVEDANGYEIYVDSPDVVLANSVLFEGFIDGWDLTGEKITATLSSIFVRWQQKSLAKYSASCRWKTFKGTECGYSGDEAWCDRSYTRCDALGNAKNFGGFRWLPGLIDKEVWWGKERSV